MADGPMLNVVDDNENIIGAETREKIHKLGLLHREVHVWLYTTSGEVIFQHRSKTMATFPDLLDATAGGHVEIGSNFDVAAAQELEEETGVKAGDRGPRFICKVRSKAYDKVTGTTNNAIRAIYACLYYGELSDLKIEPGASDGFESWSFEALYSLSPKQRARFVPAVVDDENMAMFRQLQDSLRIS